MRRLSLSVALVLLPAHPARAQGEPADEPAPGFAAHVVAADALLRLGELPQARVWLARVPEAERGFEWHYTAARADVSVQTFDAHDGEAPALDVSADGNRVATGGVDGRLSIHQAQSFMPLGDYMVGNPAAPTPIVDVAFGAESDVVVAGADGSLHAFDLARAQLRWSVQACDGPVSVVDVSPDGTRIMAASWKEVPGSARVLGLTRLFDARDGTRLADLDATEQRTSACAFSPDGMRLALGESGGRVRLLDAQTLESELALELPAAVESLTWDARGKRLAVVAGDGHAYVYAAADGRLLATLGGEGGRVTCAEFSPESSVHPDRVATGSLDGAVRVFDPASGERIATLYGTRGAVAGLAFLRDGNLVSTGADGVLRRWSPAAFLHRETPLRTGSTTHALAYDGRSRLLASASGDSEIRVWDPMRGTLSQRLVGHEASADAVVFFGDDLLASGSSDGTVRVWDLRYETEFNVFTCGSGVTALAGLDCLLFGATHGGKITLWDHCPVEISATHPFPELPRPEREIPLALPACSLAVAETRGTPTGCLLVAGCDDGVIRLWNCVSFEPAGVLEGHTARVSSLALHGQLLASASQDGTVRLWDLESRSAIATLEGHRAGVSCVAFAPDGQRLASGGSDETVRIWNVATRETVLVVSGLTGGVFALAFSPDRTQLAVGRTDGVQLLDAQPLARRQE